MASTVAPLEMWTIYFNPSDAPGLYVVRQSRVRGGIVEMARDAVIVLSLEHARKMVPPGLACVARHPEDDPVIVETWL